MCRFNRLLRVAALGWLAIPLVLSPVASAEGVEKGQVELSVAGGLSAPLGDFGDEAKTGFRIGADVGYYTSPLFVIGAEFNYHSYGASDDLVALTQILTGDPSADLKASIMQFTGYGKYLFMPRNVSPFIKAEAGIYSLKATITALGLDVSDSQSEFGIAGGGGVQFKGDGTVGGFIEIMYHSVFSEGSSTSFVDIGGGITFFVGGN